LADDLLTTIAQKAAPEHAALLVIDVQNDFAAENGFFHQVGANIPVVQRAVPRAVALVESTIVRTIEGRPSSAANDVAEETMS